MLNLKLFRFRRCAIVFVPAHLHEGYEAYCHGQCDILRRAEKQVLHSTHKKKIKEIYRKLLVKVPTCQGLVIKSNLKGGWMVG
jgi:hypothetical protein